MSIKSFGKDIWARMLLRGVHYSDRHAHLDILYRVPDPWGLDCSKEKFRFAATNAIIGREFGKVGSLLEIGCGEGFQSVYLSEICDRLHGVDISPVAIKRARERCPGGSFTPTDIGRPRQVSIEAGSDLVVACEVLYYVKALPEFVDRMCGLGSACLITYHAPHRERLAPIIARGRDVRSELICHGDTEWVASWWINAPAR